MTDRIDVFIQNSIRIRTEKGNIYVDPFRMREEPHDAAFVLITHDHYDHFSPEDIAKVACDDTVMVVPEKMSGKAAEVHTYVKEIQTVTPGISETIDWLDIETVPAYNKLKPFHPKSAGWVGYILTVWGERIYIAGDTDATPNAESVKCDVALIPIGGTYTMDARAAAGLINTMKPRVAIPVHYGDIVGKPEDADAFAKLVDDDVRVEVKIG
ncbi:MAG: MBL fold metallo-hydrolase [Lachnospiraceae bacterium]|nr:MBL fold metallo-hydrolase [Lachnospiraceae bacterium]